MTRIAGHSGIVLLQLHIASGMDALSLVIHVTIGCSSPDDCWNGAIVFLISLTVRNISECPHVLLRMISDCRWQMLHLLNIGLMATDRASYLLKGVLSIVFNIIEA